MSPEEITQRLELLRIEHRDLDAAIIALGGGAPVAILFVSAPIMAAAMPRSAADSQSR